MLLPVGKVGALACPQPYLRVGKPALMGQADLAETRVTSVTRVSAFTEEIQPMGNVGPVSCRGSGVPGDIFEWGHSVIPGTEAGIFPQWRSKNRYSCLRCYRCESTLYYSRRADCKQKAATAFREHRKQMVRKDFARDEAEADRMMRGSGVTPEFIAEMFVPMLGQPCPGMCGWPERHIITTYEDLQFDWRDPRYPLSRENCGPLCATCNQQKHDKPWPEFMHRQHSILMNLEHATPFLPPPKQEILFDLPEHRHIRVVGPVPMLPPPPGQQLGFF